MTWLLFIAFEILRNYALIEWWKKRPSYRWSYMLRFVAGVVFLLKRHPEFDPFGAPWTIWPALIYFVFQWSSFYLLFDLSLNIARGKAWDYRGKTSGVYFDLGSWRRYYAWKVASVIGLLISIWLLWARDWNIW